MNVWATDTSNGRGGRITEVALGYGPPGAEDRVGCIAASSMLCEVRPLGVTVLVQGVPIAYEIVREVTQTEARNIRAKGKA